VTARRTAAPFDICGPLPTGTTVLEASAGTGKTFTIAALATRYVAEGVAPLEELMLVTFGRAATQELRERVRDRLVDTERGLADPARASSGADRLLRHLAEAPDDEVVTRRRRLTRALATFDAATIATTHGFCQQMLAGLGVAGDTEPDATFVESIEDLLTETVDDLYVRKYHAGPDPTISYATARSVARTAVADRQARLEPTAAEPGSEAGQRIGLATAVRREVDRRKRQRRLLDYDDLLSRLRDALTDRSRGAAAQERIRSRYRVVLVDEFQDTDPVQWDILRLAFAGHTTLVLVGDPKQAIYAFRGADVVTYLDAAGSATAAETLAVNWRSDAPLLRALDVFFGGAALGDPRILVRPVESAHPGSRLVGAPSGAALRLRVLRRRQAGALVRGGLTQVDRTRERVAADLAGDVVALLGSTARLREPERPVRPADLAVLVRTNEQGVLVRDTLGRAGVPAVLAGSSSVFLTRTARDWRVLLQALEFPHRAGLVRAAALTPFLGWSAERLGLAGDDALDELGPLLRGWAGVLAERGVAALLELMTIRERLPERLLGTAGGERQLTDLRHVGQMLHAAAVEGSLGLAALAEWLQRRIADAAADTAEQRSRRLESDAEAVQVITVHRSKGLEFPVVYVPFGWDRHTRATPDPLRLHDEDGTRVLDVGGSSGPGYDARRLRHAAEESGEDLRLLYVALTRAQCSVVAWWAPCSTAPVAAMTRLLFGAAARGDSPTATVTVPTDDAAAEALKALVTRGGGDIAVEEIPAAGGLGWQPLTGPADAMSAATFDRRLDTAWRRTSYTGLTAVLHDASGPAAGVGSEPEEPERGDEAGPPAVTAATTRAPHDSDEARLRAVPSPMADLPSGPAFGTLVHAVLETVDPTAPDLLAELARRCRETIADRLGSRLDAEALAAALLPVLQTPLGPLTGGRALLDIAPADRLAELTFELPLAGGDDPRADLDLGAVAGVLRRHLPPGDPLAGYPDLLAGPLLGAQPLRGYLTGSLDAVLRVPGAGGPSYIIVDYKTNWLGGSTPGEPLTAWHYRPGALAEAMLGAHYPLQALLYAVALHRYLRWRQPGYDPARHLGGVLYLYVRGMCGPATPVVDGSPCGVFGWSPPPGLIEDLSDLLAGPA